MRPRHQLTVASAIPDELAAIAGLAANLHWAWDPATAALFDRLDGGHGGRSWRETGQHPSDLVRRTSAERWSELGDDAAFRSRLDAAASARSGGAPTWFGERSANDGSPLQSVAYFSPEFGITEMLPQYSGGLGVLAGDHLKASSDLGIPLVAVGLLYSEGYFHQRIDDEGWQREHNERLDPTDVGMVDTGARVIVDLGDTPATVRAWRVDVGGIPLYLLDTNLPENPDDIIAITDRLYGGDEQHRLRQEIVLGIGGVRVLRALDIHPQVFHTNEGHAGFLGLEQIREWTERGLGLGEAIEATRAGGVFTTHTPVPAGIDRFPRELFERYFATFADQCGITFDELFALGWRDDEPDDKFNMAVMGLRLAARANGVAELHGAVSRRMFGGLWPDLPTNDVPIGHVTNGVHARSWVSERVDELLSASMGDGWHLADAERWQRAADIDPAEIWAVRAAGRAELVSMVRSRLGDDLLDPDALTIGFARRFATYKRANLLLGQPARLRELLTDPERPVQFVFAGKAHPADHAGKSLIQQIIRFADEAGLRHRFVFVPDYDIGVARTMYHGCDVWLNTPRRPMEACGTSGEKAALNGVLNCSILDGWWAEMSDGSNGFDIASFDDPLAGIDTGSADEARRDEREGAAAFDVIEREIVPLFFERDHDGVPRRWVDRIKANWTSLGWNVIAGRMVREYVTALYEPAAAASKTATTDGADAAKALHAWKHLMGLAWPGVRVEIVSGLDDLTARAGSEAAVAVRVDRGEIPAESLVVQLLHGPLTPSGDFDETKLATVDLELHDDDLYHGTLPPGPGGRWGVTARAMPTHPNLPTVFDTGLVATG
jgi:starch phosphorylase